MAGNLELLLTFLDDYITTLSQSNFSASQTSSSPNSSSKVKKQGSSVMQNTNGEKPTGEKLTCYHCKKENHLLESCVKFLTLDIQQRLD